MFEKIKRRLAERKKGEIIHFRDAAPLLKLKESPSSSQLKRLASWLEVAAPEDFFWALQKGGEWFPVWFLRKLPSLDYGRSIHLSKATFDFLPLRPDIIEAVHDLHETHQLQFIRSQPTLARKDLRSFMFSRLMNMEPKTFLSHPASGEKEWKEILDLLERRPRASMASGGSVMYGLPWNSIVGEIMPVALAKDNVRVLELVFSRTWIKNQTSQHRIRSAEIQKLLPSTSVRTYTPIAEFAMRLAEDKDEAFSTLGSRHFFTEKTLQAFLQSTDQSLRMWSVVNLSRLKKLAEENSLA